jgi:hypothetical protein
MNKFWKKGWTKLDIISTKRENIKMDPLSSWHFSMRTISFIYRDRACQTLRWHWLKDIIKIDNHQSKNLPARTKNFRQERNKPQNQIHTDRKVTLKCIPYVFPASNANSACYRWRREFNITIEFRVTHRRNGIWARLINTWINDYLD